MKRFEEALVHAALEYKYKKHSHHGGAQRHFDQHMAEVLLGHGFFGCVPENQEAVKGCCKELLAREELVHSNYELAPHALQTLKQLREVTGLKLAACSNSNLPLRRLKALPDLFDAFVASGDVGHRKPSVEILSQVLAKFPGVKPHEAFLVGDQLDKDVACAHMAGVRSVFYGVHASNREANCKAIAHGHAPQFSILDLRQLPMIVKVMDADVKYLQEKGLEYSHETLKGLPSAQRPRIGLLQDGDGAN